MTQRSASSSAPSNCRKTVLRGAAFGGLVFFLIVAGNYMAGVFPYLDERINDLPLLLVVYALLALNLPAVIATVSLNVMAPEILEWLVYPLALIADIGAYALVGAYWCMLTRSAQSRARR
jgi:hypothetical protein